MTLRYAFGIQIHTWMPFSIIHEQILASTIDPQGQQSLVKSYGRNWDISNTILDHRMTSKYVFGCQTHPLTSFWYVFRCQTHPLTSFQYVFGCQTHPLTSFQYVFGCQTHPLMSFQYAFGSQYIPFDILVCIWIPNAFYYSVFIKKWVTTFFNVKQEI